MVPLAGEIAETKPNTSDKCWCLGRAMEFQHRRAMTPSGSHPSGTLVAEARGDHRAGQLLSTSERKDSSKEWRNYAGEATEDAGGVGIKMQKQTHFER
jgi:hypothetical protein